MTRDRFIHLVEIAARWRGEAELPRERIEQALMRAMSDEAKVRRYPSGMPSLKGVYDIAAGKLTEITID